MLRRRNQRLVSAGESDEPVIGGNMIAIAMTVDAGHSDGRTQVFCSAYSLYNVMMYHPSVPVVNWAQAEIHIVSGCR